MEFLMPYLNVIYTGLGALAFLLLILIGARLLGGRVRGRKGSRLGISEYYEIDKSRRLVLVRRDDVEHLLLIGGEHDLVVESEIGSPLSATHVAPPVRQAPRPAVFGGRRPVLRPVEGTGDMRHQREELEM
jgi:Flagellar biosynthesis protein, FliO